MRYFRRFAAFIAAALLCFEAPALTGSWRGELVLGNTKLPLVFNFSENSKGETACTMDSPAHRDSDGSGIVHSRFRIGAVQPDRS